MDRGHPTDDRCLEFVSIKLLQEEGTPAKIGKIGEGLRDMS
jgi:hypothetical protein